MLDKIYGFLKKPELYAPGTKVMWTDPHISKMLLETHLNDNIDLASRISSTRNSTIEWILDKVPSKKLNILDLGCGPGLYSHTLARKGHNVKGIDFSVRSVEYGKRRAEKESLSLEYECRDYLTLDESEKYDLVIMIFTDFGVLNPGDRSLLLEKIMRSLKPGGTFIFDVLNTECFERIKNDSKKAFTWAFEEGGFWKETPYMVLNSSHIFESEKVSLSQHIVESVDGSCDIYRFWVHYFGSDDLFSILNENGFSKPSIFNNVLPESEFVKKNETSFVVCIKDM